MRARQRNLKRSKDKALRYGSLALVGAAAVGGAGMGNANQVHAATQQSGGKTPVHSQASSTAKNIASQSGTSQGSSTATSSGSKNTSQSNSNNADKNASHPADRSVDPQFGPLAGHPSAQIIASTYGYQIQSGDNLASIASVHHVSQQSVVHDNPGVNFDHLVAGTQLRISHNGMTNHRLGFTFTNNGGLVVNAHNSTPPKMADLQFDHFGEQTGQQSAGSAAAVQTSTYNAQQSASSEDMAAASAANKIPTDQASDSTSNQESDVQSLGPTDTQSAQTIAEHENDLYRADANPADHTIYRINNQANTNQTTTSHAGQGRTNAVVTNRTRPRTVQSTNLGGTEAQARNWIGYHESGNNYYAQNGDHYGRFQLTDSYLHGNYSPANQDRTANNYVQQRYGNWSNAKTFWQAHHWY